MLGPLCCLVELPLAYQGDHHGGGDSQEKIVGRVTAVPLSISRTVLFRSREDLSGLVLKGTRSHSLCSARGVLTSLAISTLPTLGEPIDLETEEGKKLLKLIVPSAQEINFRIGILLMYYV